MIKSTAFVLTLIFLFSLVGCRGVVKDEACTLNTYVQASPKNWSKHSWESQADAMVQSYCEMGLVDIAMGADGGFEWVFEMASDITDVTGKATLEQRSRWNITESDGRMFKISLNKKAQWEDGRKIDAQTYIYSMQQLLSPKMKNSRADVYIAGENAIYNADKFQAGKVQWQDVGLYKEDDYTLIYVTKHRQSRFGFFMAVLSNWIVHPELYEGGKEEKGGRVITNYGTAAQYYMAYGPYRLASFEKDKQMQFVKNESWYGWNDGLHEGQYQTRKIRVNIIADRATVMQMFQRGELDTMELTYDELATYAGDENLQITPQSYTMRFSFNTSPSVLARLEGQREDGSNLRILSNISFRRAISLCFDRQVWCDNATAGHYPQVALLGDMYIYDAEKPDSVYRDTEQAMQAIVNAYGVRYGEGQRYQTLEQAYRGISGYDIIKARELFSLAFEQSVADGIYTKGQRVVIHVGASASAPTAELEKQERMFNAFLENGTEGTELEGLVRVKYIYNLADRYGDTASGIRECCYGGLGGAAFFPYRGLNSYIDAAHAVGGRIVEGGFDAEKIMLDITSDFGNGTETVRKSLLHWNRAITQDGQYFDAPHSVRLAILAGMEQCILEQAHCFPVSVSSSLSVHSNKISYGARTYNVMYGFGGLRHMTYKG